MNNPHSIDGTYIEEQFILSSRIFKEGRTAQANTLLQQLIARIEAELPGPELSRHPSDLKKRLSQCYLSRAVCLLEGEDDHADELIQDCLQKAINMNYLNMWAYFNLASYHYHYYNYVTALEYLKCALSVLYLSKAVLSKDPDTRNSEKDLGKAIGLASNNLEAELIRLLIHIKQRRWKNAVNQICIVQEITGQNKNLDALQHLLAPFDFLGKKQEQPEFKTLWKSVAGLVKQIRVQNNPRKLMANSEEVVDDNYAKAFNQRMYEFNQLFHQVNQLGSVYGAFHFKTTARIERNNRKTGIMTNTIRNTITKSEQQQHSHLSPQPSQTPDLQAKIIDQNSQSKESLFELTKSHNQCIDNSNRQAQISGNLLSTLKVTQKPLIVVEQSPQSHLSSFNLQSILVNMRKKDCQIRTIQSQIKPLDMQEDDEIGTPYINNHHFIAQEDDDLLLDSAFHPQINTKPPVTANSTEIKKQKIQQKRIRLYPLNDIYKYLEIFLVQIELKEPNKSNPSQIYCELEIKGALSTQKLTSKKIQARQVGQKITLQCYQSLSCIAIPEQPHTLEAKIMRCENDKYFDTCLGQGEMEMTSTGINKLPVYNSTGMIGITTIRLIPHEQYLASSSFKQSSLSSSKKSETSQS